MLFCFVQCFMMNTFFATMRCVNMWLCLQIERIGSGTHSKHDSWPTVEEKQGDVWMGECEVCGSDVKGGVEWWSGVKGECWWETNEWAADSFNMDDLRSLPWTCCCCHLMSNFWNKTLETNTLNLVRIELWMNGLNNQQQKNSLCFYFFNFMFIHK